MFLDFFSRKDDKKSPRIITSLMHFLTKGEEEKKYVSDHHGYLFYTLWENHNYNFVLILFLVVWGLKIRFCFTVPLTNLFCRFPTKKVCIS